VALAAASPDSRAVCVIDDSGRAVVSSVEPGHVEVSMRTLFGKVLYEGYDEPAYVYQSTGSTQAEPKFSLIPLIFGTMKATIVAMFVAVPLAVLAAIYSSEFLHRDVRRYVKPTIELLASLPSVVLGFIAAMVVAPFVRDQLPRLMTFALIGPLAVVFAAHAWRAARGGARTEWGRVGRFALIAAAVLLGAAVSIPAGTLLEHSLFGRAGGGSIINWLNEGTGPATPGWFVVLLIPVIAVMLVVDAAVLGPVWRRFSRDAPGRRACLIELGRLVINLTVSLGAAYALASVLDSAGFDPRHSIFGPFSQRNTLVVGLIMGVAVVPIIYTISEDAIHAVPGRLRSASLGVGATPWQTALRVVLPVAGSGVFSAVMIGLGRAVGETMIVLMATGNTPEMSMNIFSGFRTLAANIAVELPEAPAGGTHYRVLFLCGLVLFAMTLIINTTAEVVRQHFRKRNAAL
ncbi:MAG TPA: ABC transporter permease subunit, partial [Phycisphaerales bacterium]|nr:ABC transporter permease subunit [Phycisphaerales bacterium]